MRNKKYGLVLIIIAIFFCSGCKRNMVTNTDVTPIKLHPQEAEVALKASQLECKLECEILEIPDDLVLGEVIKIEEVEGSVFIADRKNLFEFSSEGKFKRCISRVGAGPNEYLGISDFVVDAASNCWILSRNNKAIFCFDTQGTQIRKISFDYWASKIAIINKSQMALYIGNEVDGDNKCRLKILDIEKGKVVGESLSIDPIQSGYLHINSVLNFSHHDDQSLYFYETFNDTVYYVTNNCCVPKYYMDLNGKNIPQSFYKTSYENIMEFFQALNKGNYAYGCTLFMEFDRGIICSYLYKGKSHLSILSDSKKENSDLTTIIEDAHLYGYPIDLIENKLFPQPNSRIIIPIETGNIMDYIEENSLANTSELLRTIKGKETTILVTLQF